MRSTTQLAIDWANAQKGTSYTHAEITGHCRKAPLVQVRSAAQWFLYVHKGWSYPRIARVFGNRDHASIMHLVSKQNLRLGLPKDYPLVDRKRVKVRINDGGNAHETAIRV